MYLSTFHDLTEPVEILEYSDNETPLVVSSPHSGSHYPADLIDASLLSKVALRRSEDCYIDDLFSAAADVGVPLLKAVYARAYIDLNREPFELDPAMFTDPLPDYCNTSSARVVAGLGTIARIVANQKEIYARKLTFSEAEARIDRIHKPYHQSLRRLVNRARDQHGFCMLLDCHSMPSIGLPNGNREIGQSIDIVLGDRNGLSCSSAITEEAERIFGGLGYAVVRNNPYAGGFTTHHYGEPSNGVHALQIEINRSLYMDEDTLGRRPGFAKLKADIRQFMEQLVAFSQDRHSELGFQRLSAE